MKVTINSVDEFLRYMTAYNDKPYYNFTNSGLKALYYYFTSEVEGFDQNEEYDFESIALYYKEFESAKAYVNYYYDEDDEEYKVYKNMSNEDIIKNLKNNDELIVTVNHSERVILFIG